MKINMDGLAPKVSARSGPIAVGDILRTRQGRMYLVIATPPPTREWRMGGRIYYLGIDRNGDITTGGGTLDEYAESNWELIGRMPFEFGEPEWYI